MSRTQILRSGGQKLSVTPGTPVALSATDKWVKSVQITAIPTNTDFVYVGGSTGQGNPLEPRRTCEVTGDGMDNGTYAKINLKEIYIDVAVSGEGVSYIYLEGL